MVHFFLLKPLKSNFLQFLEEASTGQCVGAIPDGPYNNFGTAAEIAGVTVRAVQLKL